MGRRTTLLVGGAVAVALALGGLVGGVLAESPSAGPSPAAPVALAERALAGAAGGISASAVAGLEQQVRSLAGRRRRSSRSSASPISSAGARRPTPAFLPRSEAALRRALRARPGDANAVLGLGSLALIRHEFREALSYGRRAQRLLPGSARPYGVIGDALVELGRYDEAFRRLRARWSRSGRASRRTRASPTPAS